jgi:hypothetical protein
MDEIEITQVEFPPEKKQPDNIRKSKTERPPQQSASIPGKGRRKPDGGMR